MSTSPSTEPVSRRALVLVHDEDLERGHRTTGLFLPALSELGFKTQLFSVLRDEPIPEPSGYDIVLVMGSEASAYDTSLPWISVEEELLRRIDQSGVPILAICFGAQVLTRVFGGSVVSASAGPELGFVQVDTARADILPPGPWFSSHWDQMLPGPDAWVIGRTDHSVQVWAQGPHLAIQFHPEADGAAIRSWLERRLAVGGEMPEPGEWIDVDGVVAALDAKEASNHAACRALLERFLDGAFRTAYDERSAHSST